MGYVITFIVGGCVGVFTILFIQACRNNEDD